MWNQYRWYLASIWKIEKTSPDGAVIQKYQKQMLKWGYLHYWSTPRDPRGSKRSAMIHLTCFWRFGALRLTPFEENSKNLQKTDIFDEFFSILMVFSSLFSFGSILAHQTSSGMFSEWFCFIWHPWGPWGRVNSGEKGFSGQTATVLLRKPELCNIWSKYQI